MLYLHEKGLRVPYPVRPRQHAQIFVAGVDGHKVEKQLVVRLLSWVDGETMNETGCDADMLAEADRYVRERERTRENERERERTRENEREQRERRLRRHPHVR